jgi:diguanylate cyclase (GGDEF)-like protein/PAS domain S-box-containing protein
VPDTEGYSDEAIETAWRALVIQHPQAAVGAINELGLYVPTPASLGLGDRPPAPGRSALDLVIPSDRISVIDAWGEARDRQLSRTTVHLSAQPDEAVALHFFDVRPRHGVFLGVFVVHNGDDLVASSAEMPMLRARWFRQRKDAIAVFVDVDEAVEEVLGWRADDMVGKASLEFVHPDDHTRAIEHWMEMLGTPGARRRVRLRHRHANGRWVWLELTNTNRLDDPAEPCVETEAVDISDEMAAHEAVRERERLLERMAQTVPLGLLHVDASGTVVYANERVSQIIGCAAGATLTEHFAGVHEADQPGLHLAIERALRDAIDADVECSVRRDDGEERRLQVRLGALVDGTGTPSGAVVSVDDVTERARLHAELRHRAEFDPLTECRRRAAVLGCLEESLGDGPVTVVFVDLDGFKGVNDRHGHATGDALLTIAAQRLANAVRPKDVVGRLGGDEFLVVCRDVAGDDARRTAVRIADTLAQPAVIGTVSLPVRASIGVATSDGSQDVEELVEQADVAMYESKRRGTCRPVFYEPAIDARGGTAA